MSTDLPDQHDDDAAERPSKTQRKNEMKALQALGERIIAMSEAERARLPLSEDMRFAVEETSRIRSHEGRRRHMQYVGKVMRREDLPAIQAAFDAMEQEAVRRDQAFHRLERWRDRLIDDTSAESLEAFIAEYPDVDRQTLRQLIRNAKSERQREKPPTNARKLFRLIRETAGMPR
ncbi:ribosome biogenesis factor YjgA [Chromohalobacter israelensis]|uniref:ribosome biogenesis factor YjgA n=1 Tax=Chromohalobacter israelensis TaxID=141390 RepID=UPI0015C47EE0|nr:ribosome biogenesis factor YjgA [Chromohalobacter salexigens]NWO56985.1 ribosome-associated protein [Chromohalobacter salexigens]